MHNYKKHTSAKEVINQLDYNDWTLNIKETFYIKHLFLNKAYNFF